ncbi:TPA: TcfC E-set like domain-containing protein [Aeromonas sobria]|nr:TcfC E-set like domain-containing protein [Aeromonas sobria]
MNLYARVATISLILTTTGQIVAAELTQDYAQVMREKAPDDFMALLAPRTMPTEFVLVNGNSVMLTAALGNYEVRLDDENSTEKLKEFLLANNLTERGAQQVAELLRSGKETAPDCKGDKQRCEVKVEDNVSVVVDAPGKRVRLMLAPPLFAEDTGNPEFHSAYNSSPALINRFSLFRSRFDGNVNSSINDKVVLGLPYGHIRSELRGYSSSKEGGVDVDVDSLEYNLDVDGYRLMAGRSRSFNSQNTTSLLNFSSQQKEGAYLMSSRNLMRGNISAYQRAYFYMSQAGAVEAYRDGQLLFSRPVEAGQQYISYDQLPAGTYQLTLKLKSGDNVETEQVVSINNNPSVTLPTGHMDFMFGVSRLEDDNDDEHLPIMEGSVAFRPVDHLQLASGFTVSNDDRMISGGISWAVNNDLRLDGAVGLFSDSVRYLQTNLTWGSVNLGYQALKGMDAQPLSSAVSMPQRKRTLASMLLGQDRNYQQASLSVSYPVGSLYAYGSLFYNQSEDGVSNNKTETISANTGVSIPVLSDSTVSFNLGISQNLNDLDDGQSSNSKDVTLGVNWSMPLGERTNAIFNVQGSRNNKESGYSTVRHQFEPMGDFTTSLEAGARYNGTHTDMTASGSLGYKGEAFSASANGTLNQGGPSNAFVSLEGTQIVSSEGIHLSADHSESYLMVKNEGTMELPDASSVQAGRLVMGNERQFSAAKEYKPGDKPLLTTLGSYQYHSVKLQSDNGQLYNRGDQDIRGFAFPGSLITMQTRFEQEFQLLGAFYLPNGRPAPALSCEGDACLQVEKLDDGLFKIRLSGDGGYQLLSGNSICLDDRKVDKSNALNRIARVDCKPAERYTDGPALLARNPK